MKTLFLMTIIAVTIIVTSCSHPKYTKVQTQAIEWLVQEGSILATDSVVVDTTYYTEGIYIFEDKSKFQNKWEQSVLRVYGDVFEKKFQVTQHDTTGAVGVDIVGIDYSKWIYDQLKRNGVDSTSKIVEMKKDHGLFLTDNGQSIAPVWIDQIDGKNHSLTVISNVITEYPDDTINKDIKNLIISYTLEAFEEKITSWLDTTKTYEDRLISRMDTTIINVIESTNNSVLLLIDEKNGLKPIMIEFEKNDSSAHVIGGIVMVKTKDWGTIDEPIKQFFTRLTIESFKRNIDGFRELSK